MEVIGGDGGVGPVAFGLRCHAEDEQAAQKSSQGRNNQEHPRPQRAGCFSQHGRFSPRRVWMVARPDVQSIMKNDLARREENNRSGTCDDAHGQREHHQAGLRSKALAAEIQNSGNQRSGWDGT